MPYPLEARASEAERRRRLPDETIAEAAAAGVFSMLVPATHGGAGLGLASVAQATRTLAHGCVSSAWTLSVLLAERLVWQRIRGDPAGPALLPSSARAASAANLPCGRLQHEDEEARALLGGLLPHYCDIALAVRRPVGSAP
jgi:hypothetical protein